MNTDHDELLASLGVDVGLHQQLIEYNATIHERTHLSQQNRPAAMALFDAAAHAVHGDRVAAIAEYRNAGGKSIGTFCIYVPDEIALAAGVLPIPLCGGTQWSVDYADKMFPRDICPLVRSTFGMAFSNTCPYKKLKDAAVGETTCDAKKKAWDLLGFTVLEVPQKKNARDRTLWHEEVREFQSFVERLSGVRVTFEALQREVRRANRKRRVLQEIHALRREERPPLSGLDALLVSQAALAMDTDAFIDAATQLLDELRVRVRKGISAYATDGPRVIIAGTPSPLGNAKVHYAVESSDMRIVADESCTGSRYYRDLVDETPGTLDGLLAAVADRYFAIDCSCFSPNRERLDHLDALVDEYRADGVVQNILSFCHGYNIEAKAVELAMQKRGIPTLKIVTDYSFEDVEQMRVRLEPFREVLNSRPVV